MFYYITNRKVHITDKTLQELKGEYKVVEGHGGDRDDFLKQHNINTWFIDDSEVSTLYFISRYIHACDVLFLYYCSLVHFVIIMISFLVDSWGSFAHVLQGFFTSTGLVSMCVVSSASGVVL